MNSIAKAIVIIALLLATFQFLATGHENFAVVCFIAAILSASDL